MYAGSGASASVDDATGWQTHTGVPGSHQKGALFKPLTALEWPSSIYGLCPWLNGFVTLLLQNISPAVKDPHFFSVNWLSPKK